MSVERGLYVRALPPLPRWPALAHQLDWRILYWGLDVGDDELTVESPQEALKLSTDKCAFCVSGPCVVAMHSLVCVAWMWQTSKRWLELCVVVIA